MTRAQAGREGRYFCLVISPSFHNQNVQMIMFRPTDNGAAVEK